MREERRKQACIMVVDDEPQNVRYVSDVLQWAGYERVESFTDPTEAVSRFAQRRPDIVILDLLMPGMDGFAVMEAMRDQLDEDEYLPFLILTSDISSDSRRRALSSGAKDFLTKPMSPTEVRLRVDNLLDTRLLYLEVAEQAKAIEKTPPAHAPAPSGEPGIEEELLERWSASLEAALDVEGSSKRVSWLAGRVAEALELPPERVDEIRHAALLHLLGARHVAAVSAATQDHAAWSSVHPDPDAGARLLEGASVPSLVAARRMLAALDERWDGTGQPRGLRGEAIPIEARIVAAARYHDHTTHGVAEGGAAMDDIESLAGRAFDPQVVSALLRIRPVDG